MTQALVSGRPAYEPRRLKGEARRGPLSEDLAPMRNVAAYWLGMATHRKNPRLLSMTPPTAPVRSKGGKSQG